MIAGLLVDELGAGAIAVAQQRAQRALSENDIGTNAVWRAVSAAAATYLAAGTRTRPVVAPRRKAVRRTSRPSLGG